MKCDVLVTHVPPVLIPDELKGDYKSNSDNIFYESDNLDAVISTGTELVISGHVHEDYDYEITNGIRHIINPLGYKHEYRKSSIKQIIYKKKIQQDLSTLTV